MAVLAIMCKIAVVILVLAFIGIQLRAIQSTSSEYTILQLHQPTKDRLEEAIRTKQPVIITGIVDQWEMYPTSPNDIVKSESTLVNLRSNNGTVYQVSLPKYLDWLVTYQRAILSEKGSSPESPIYCERGDLVSCLPGNSPLDEYTHYFAQPLSPSSKHFVTISPVGSQHAMRSFHVGRHVLFLTQGEILLHLFAPDQSPFLYPTEYGPKTREDNGLEGLCRESQANYWKPDLTQFPDISKGQFLEVVLRQGQIIVIPAGWWYAIKTVDTSIWLEQDSYSVTDRLICLFQSLGGYYRNHIEK